eukprot:6084374-Amphidinium_carterae.1
MPGPSVEDYEREHSSLEVSFAQSLGDRKDRKRARRNLSEAMINQDPKRDFEAQRPVVERVSASSEISPAVLPKLAITDRKVEAKNEDLPQQGIDQILRLEVRGELAVPLVWTEQQIRQNLAERFKVRLGRVTIYRSSTGSKQKTLARVTEVSMEHKRWIQGAGKSQRVGQQSLEAVVLGKLKQDVLISPGIAKLETRLLEHMTRTDPKLTRAAFQAKSIPQRLEALAAAFHRAGLPDLKEQTKLAAEEHRRQLQAANIEEEAISPQEEGTSSGEAPPELHVARAHRKAESDPGVVNELIQKVKALELWAHAVDASQEQLPSRADTCESIVRSVELRLREIAASQVQMFFEGHLREAMEKAVQALAQTAQGMLIEHNVVRQMLEQDSFVVQDILRSQTVIQTYQILARTLHRSGHRRLALGLAKAIEVLTKKEEGDESKTEVGSSQDAGLEETVWTAITEAELAGTQDTQGLLDIAKADDAEEQAESDPYQQAGPARKRGRPPGPAKQAQNQASMSLEKFRDRVEGLTSALAELGKRVKQESNRTDDLENRMQSQAQAGSFRQVQDLAEISNKVTKLDEWLAELGGENLKSAAALRQVREAVGLKEFDPDTNPPEDGCQEVCIPLAIQLIESRILAIERGTAPASSDVGLSGEVSTYRDKLEACEKKIANLGATIERVARVCQTVWNGSQILTTRLQTVHEIAAMAIQQTSALRALVSPTAF